MSYTNLEFVCGGNSGRSPIAEAVARKYLRDTSQDPITVSSSGTLVDYLETAEESILYGLIRDYIPIALEREIITPGEALKLAKGEDVRKLLRRTSAAELARTKKILAERSLLDYFGTTAPKQTVAQPGDRLIFALSTENYKRIGDLYSGVNQAYRLELLGDFQDPFCASIEEHRRIADHIERETIRVMREFY